MFYSIQFKAAEIEFWEVIALISNQGLVETHDVDFN